MDWAFDQYKKNMAPSASVDIICLSRAIFIILNDGPVHICIKYNMIVFLTTKYTYLQVICEINSFNFFLDLKVA